jgi:hypothetical protein
MRHTHLAPPDGPVVLDVGGDIGALVVQLDDDRIGTELELRLLGERRRTHTGVWRRSRGNVPVVVAVFASLVAGQYAVLDGEATMALVSVSGGEVAEVDLCGIPTPPRA